MERMSDRGTSISYVKTRLAICVLLVAAGCSSQHPDASGVAIHGTVLAAPTCEVEREGSPCPPAPVARKRVIATHDGRTIASAITDDMGRFTLHLATGRYLVRLDSRGGYADTGARRLFVRPHETQQVQLLVRTMLGGG